VGPPTFPFLIVYVSRIFKASIVDLGAFVEAGSKRSVNMASIVRWIRCVIAQFVRSISIKVVIIDVTQRLNSTRQIIGLGRPISNS